MRTYKPATFQPTVRPDWAGMLSYIPEKEKSEILVALIKYPSVECNSQFWLETIKPDLDMQFSEFKRVCQEKSRGIRERWGKTSITYEKTSITYEKTSITEESNNNSKLHTRNNINNNNNNINNNNNNINNNNINNNNTSSSSKLHTRNNIYYNNTTRATRANFTPPTDANQVYEYGAANGMVCTMNDAEDFFDYYSGIGWCIGNEHRTPMVAWEPFWKKWLRNPVVRQKPSVKMSVKEMKELANQQELEKIRRGER